MKWWPEPCEAGDMVRVKVGSVWHYGVFVSEREVIEFGPPPVGSLLTESAGFRIMAADVDEFSAGGIVERAVLDRAEQKKRLPPDRTVALARERLGEGGYDLLHNNCEHFAYACVFGVGRSEQEEALRRKWTDRPILDVFLAAIPEKTEPGPVYPPERAAWIADAAAPTLRRERYAVWKLLERAIRRSFGLAMEDLRFTEKDGKWSCDRLEFSLSHSGAIAAAAVSNSPVGVDVESLDAFARRGWDGDRLRRIERRVCTPQELRALRDGEDFLRLWTKKESIFKCSGKGSILTHRIDTAAHRTETRMLSCPAPCVVSVCGARPERLRLFLADEAGIRLLPPETAGGERVRWND